MTDRDNTDKERADQQTAAAQDIIQLFGGIRPMAGKLGVAVSTVQGWKERDTIPQARHADILAAARKHGIELAEERLAEAGDSPGPSAIPLTAKPGETASAPTVATSTAPSKPESKLATDKPATDKPAAPPSKDGSGSRPTTETSTSKDRTTDRPATATPPRTGSPERAAGPSPVATPTAGGRGGGSWIGAFVLGAVVFAVGAGGAVLTRDAWLPYFGDAPAATGDGEALAVLTAEMKELDGQLKGAIGRLEGELGEMTSALGALDEPSGELEALTEMREQFAVMGSQMEALEAKLDNRPAVSPDDLASLTGDQAALAARLEELEGLRGDLSAQRAALEALSEDVSGIRGAVNGDTALLLAGLQLRDAARFDAPFAGEHATMTRLAGDDAAFTKALAAIAPYAADGVPSLEGLKTSFPDMAAAVVAAQRAAETGDGWVSGAVKRVSNLVSLRPVGAVEGDGPGAAVARAEVHLSADDLAGAVSELESLSGEATDAAAGWLTQAKGRLAVDATLDELAAAMARRLGLEGG
jgi:hypothetical protein